MKQKNLDKIVGAIAQPVGEVPLEIVVAFRKRELKDGTAKALEIVINGALRGVANMVQDAFGKG